MSLLNKDCVKTRAETPKLQDAEIKDLLKETKYQLRYRDQVLESDQFRSPERNDVIRKSKNFIVRNALIKLGFDTL